MRGTRYAQVLFFSYKGEVERKRGTSRWHAQREDKKKGQPRRAGVEGLGLVFDRLHNQLGCKPDAFAFLDLIVVIMIANVAFLQ